MDQEAQEFRQYINSEIKHIDESIEYEIDLFNHCRGLYHEKELRDELSNVIAQVYVERTHDQKIKISCLSGSNPFKMNPHLFKVWIASENYSLVDP